MYDAYDANEQHLKVIFKSVGHHRRVSVHQWLFLHPNLHTYFGFKPFIVPKQEDFGVTDLLSMLSKIPHSPYPLRYLTYIVPKQAAQTLLKTSLLGGLQFSVESRAFDAITAARDHVPVLFDIYIKCR